MTRRRSTARRAPARGGQQGYEPPAQHRWRRLNSAHLLPLVRAGVTFVDGVQKERNMEEDRKEAA